MISQGKTAAEIQKAEELLHKRLIPSFFLLTKVLFYIPKLFKLYDVC